jgi:hypothetical protein
MTSCMRLLLAAVAFALFMQLTGCAQMTMTPPKPTIENTVKLRGKALTPATVGTIAPDPRKPEDADRGLSIRGNGLASPVNGSFAQYLAETLKVELQSAGLYDSQSKTAITGSLVESDVDASVGAGKAVLAARIVVSRAGAVRYDREVRVASAWDSPFVGVVAVPLAAGEFERLYRALAGKLFDDQAFLRALSND